MITKPGRISDRRRQLEKTLSHAQGAGFQSAFGFYQCSARATQTNLWRPSASCPCHCTRSLAQEVDHLLKAVSTGCRILIVALFSGDKCNPDDSANNAMGSFPRPAFHAMSVARPPFYQLACKPLTILPSALLAIRRDAISPHPRPPQQSAPPPPPLPQTSRPEPHTAAATACWDP